MTRRTRLYSRANGVSERELLLAGADHLEASAHLFLTNHPCFLDSAGYLASLAFELFLKAGLLHTMGQFPATHDLEQLASLLQCELGRELGPEPNAALRKLNRFASLRYPDSAASVSIKADDIERIDGLFVAIMRLLPPPVVRTYKEMRGFDADGLMRKSDRVLMVKPLDDKESAGE